MTNPMLDAVFEMQKTAHEEAFDAWQRVFNLPRLPKMAREARVATSPHDVVYEEDSLKLLHYRNERSIEYAEPVLVCFALVNRPYILDLQPERSIIQQLLKRGFDVYMVDWGVPTAADRTMRLYDYICGLLNNVVDFACDHSGSPNLNLLGYCMGGTMSAMYTTLFPERVRNLIMMAAPIDFDDGGLLSLWTQEEHFDVDGLIDAYGNCPATLLQSAFQLMKPVQNIYEKYTGFLEKLHDEAFLDNFFAMEKWGSDNIPVAGETFREFVKMLYQRNMLVKGEMHLNDVPIKLEKITCPLLLLVADGDHLVPACSTLALADHVSSKDVKRMSLEVGHVGLAVSSKAHRQFWPEATKWIAERSTARAPS